MLSMNCFKLASSRRGRINSIDEVLTCVCLLLSASTVAAAQEKKLEIPELLSRHLEAVGSAEVRVAIKSRFAAGTVKYVSRIGGGGNLEGTIGYVSLGPKTRFSIKFLNPQYPGEQLAYDGKNLELGVQPAGRRSDLNLFIDQQNLPIKDGLLGGVLSTAWPLLKDPIPARLEYKGTRKIDGRPLHALVYHQQKGSPDLKVTLFFDPETFRHVRSEYEFQIGARMGVGPNQSTRIPESRYLLSEDFEDFRAVDGLTLPHKVKLQLSVQASASNRLIDWTLSLDQIVHNQPIEDNVFSLKP
ncbi:MAG TPA: hypothetical protein VNS63_02255 [Blastocatellia bacterium]|nr:hypothetical protein [Blastocatellia bacterium]